MRRDPRGVGQRTRPSHPPGPARPAVSAAVPSRQGRPRPGPPPTPTARLTGHAVGLRARRFHPRPRRHRLLRAVHGCRCPEPPAAGPAPPSGRHRPHGHHPCRTATAADGRAARPMGSANSAGGGAPRGGMGRGGGAPWDPRSVAGSWRGRGVTG